MVYFFRVITQLQPKERETSGVLSSECDTGAPQHQQLGSLPMKRAFILCLLMMFLLPCVAMGKESPAGKAKTIKGNVSIIRDGRQIPVSVGDRFFQKDTIRTGVESSVGIIFEDNTILSLGPESEVVIDEYVFAPEKGLFSMIARMVKGTASYLSGIIGHQSPESVKFRTPEATIGIRGTHFLVKVNGCL